jgi:hypothetical protein
MSAARDTGGVEADMGHAQLRCYTGYPRTPRAAFGLGAWKVLIDGP